MKQDMNANDFSVVERTNYVAMQLFPYASKQNARRLLTGFVKRNQQLAEALSDAGWNCSDIFITRAQIRILLHFFCD